jgi:hypothetical protein
MVLTNFYSFTKGTISKTFFYKDCSPYVLSTNELTNSCISFNYYKFIHIPERAKTTVWLEAPKMAPAMKGATAPAK